MTSIPVEVEDVPCPMGCGTDDAVVLRGRDRLHGLPGEFTLVRCRSCGLLRTTPRPTPESIGFYYPGSYRPYQSTRVEAMSGASPAPPRGGRLRRWLREPKTHILPPMPPGRLVEIGCGSGGFMDRLAERGWEVEGVEFSPDAAEAARALGYLVHVGALEQTRDPVKPYDLVVGWMVVEHLHDPIGALRKLARWTKPGGWLAISTPDAGSLEFKLFGDAWYALHLPNHLFLYSVDTLRNVLARAGWRMERVFWHDNPNNLLMSLRFRCLEKGWTRLGAYLLDVAEGRRGARVRYALGKLLGALRASGRITVWARRA